ncbi:MAG TPA: ABC transporter permease [Pyrinomonadaceae bacterium]|nr:ABC transporter permease [Pyrinomonadaceae bacterium]
MALPRRKMNPEVQRPNRKTKLRNGIFTDYLGMALVLAALVVAFGLTTQHFLTLTTFRTIANQIPDAVLVATGMTFVLIVGGIDLSVGSVLALGGSLLGVSLVRYHLPLPVAVAACLGVGLMCGLINGVVIARWAIPSFIVTLGMMEMARGGAYLVANSQTQYIGGSIEAIAETSVLGLSLPFLFAVAVAVAGQFVLSHTVFGRRMIAVGANEDAARLSGVDARGIKLVVFMLCGFLASIAAVMQSARLSSADPNAGAGSELQAIAAVVIGGTSLMGGRGSVVNSFFGVLIIAVLGAGLAQMGAQEPTKRLITGGVIVAAVLLDHYRHRLHRK